MRKLIAVLFMAFAVVCSAQNIKPEFQAFSGALLKLKPAEKGFHKFQLKVDVAPWAFQATGEVQAPGGDADVLITGLFDGDVYAVLAYVPSSAEGTDGKSYQVGFFDMMLYFEDEPTRIRNLKFKLLPPANDEWAVGILKDALSSGSLLGNVWGGKYDKAITKASADPMDKKKLQALQNKPKKTLSDDDGTISKKSRRVDSDMETAPKKPAKKLSDDDGTINKKKRRVDEEEDVKPAKKKKKSLGDPCEDPSLSVKEQRQCKLKSKK